DRPEDAKAAEDRERLSPAHLPEESDHERLCRGAAERGGHDQQAEGAPALGRGKPASEGARGPREHARLAYTEEEPHGEEQAAAGFEKIDLANGGGDLSGGRVFLQAPADTGGRLPLAARGAESPRAYSGRVRDRGAGVAEARRARSATSAGSGRPPGTREVQGAWGGSRTTRWSPTAKPARGGECAPACRHAQVHLSIPGT